MTKLLKYTMFLLHKIIRITNCFFSLLNQSLLFRKKQYKYPSESYAQAASGFESPIENFPEKYDQFQKIMNAQKQIEALLDPYKSVNPQYNYLDVTEKYH